jgi:hypothetical protein
MSIRNNWGNIPNITMNNIKAICSTTAKGSEWKGLTLAQFACGTIKENIMGRKLIFIS